MDWMELLQALLYVVITVCLPLVIKAVWPYLKSKSEEAVLRVENELAKEYLGYAVTAVFDSVAYVAQTYVDSLKKAGKFTEEAAKEAFSMAKTRALELMSDEVKEFILMTYGDVNVWLQTKIEAEVNARKLNEGVLVGAEPLDE